jgi:hypothetical protein
MKPSGAAPSWWLRSWEEEARDLRSGEMRTVSADEMGDEILADGVDDTGALTGEQSTLQPDTSHPAVAAYIADAELSDASAAEAGTEVST